MEAVGILSLTLLSAESVSNGINYCKNMHFCSLADREGETNWRASDLCVTHWSLCVPFPLVY